MSALSDGQLSDLLAQTHTIAAVGLSGDPASDSYQVAAYQQSQGYTIIPVNPDEKSILGFKAVPDLADIQAPVDIVQVYPHGGATSAIARAASRIGARALWLQPGVDAPGTIPDGTSQMDYIQHRCFRAEHRRLLSHPVM